jgi:hypothetical protein
MNYADYQFKDEIDAPDFKNIPSGGKSIRRVQNFAVNAEGIAAQ